MRLRSFAVVGVWLMLAAGTSVEPKQVWEQTPDPAKAMAWAESRFTLAGIEIPPYRFAISDCTDVRATWDGTTITLCALDDGTTWTLLHELGHAYASANLTVKDEGRLLNEWGTAAWNDTTDEWSERGTEQFANMIAWALYPTRRDCCPPLTYDQMMRSLADLGVAPLWQP